MAQGLLTGRYNHPDEVPDGVSRSRLFAKDRSPMAIHKDIGCEKILFNTISKLKILSKENDIPMAIMSLGWLKTRPGILSILIGCRNIEEVNLNVPAFNYNPKKELNKKISVLTEDIKIYVGNNPDIQPVLHGRINSDTRNVCGILADAFHGRDITAVFATIHHHTTWRRTQNCTSGFII